MYSYSSLLHVKKHAAFVFKQERKEACEFTDFTFARECFCLRHVTTSNLPVKGVRRMSDTQRRTFL